LAGITTNDPDVFYQLTGPVTIPSGWTPIGTFGAPFKGTFDGGGCQITLQGNPGSAGAADIGLFGYTKDAEIRDLKVVIGYSLLTLTGSGDQNVGGVAGSADHTVFENVTVSGILDISGTGTGGSFGAGGLAGQLSNTSSVSGCSSTVIVTVAASKTYNRVGGLAGNSTNVQIEKSFATGAVTASASTGVSVYAGGLVGVPSGSTSIADCYATGNVSAEAATPGTAVAGGLVGEPYDTASITRSYASGTVLATCSSPGTAWAGGLVGHMGVAGTSITFSVALSPSVMAQTASIMSSGMVVGWHTAGTCNDNKALDGVTPNPGGGIAGDPPNITNAGDQSSYAGLGWSFTPGTGVWVMNSVSPIRPVLRGITP
jgi:hypothetical protein